MPSSTRCSFLSIAIVGVLVGACSSGTNGGSGGGSGGGGTGGGSGGGSGGVEITPDPRTPDSGTGCGALTACHLSVGTNPFVCTDLQTDALNCGSCGGLCPGPAGCVASTCTDAGTCAQGVFCGAECVSDRKANPNNCGSCGNRCGEREVCSGYACEVGGGGTGDRCDSPLVLPGTTSASGFHLNGALVGSHIFSCGPLSAVPTRWVRKTAVGNQLDIFVNAPLGNHLIVEVFDSPCSADGGMVSLGCNDATATTLPKLKVTATVGKSYLVAVGVVAGTPDHASIDF